MKNMQSRFPFLTSKGLLHVEFEGSVDKYTWQPSIQIGVQKSSDEHEISRVHF